MSVQVITIEMGFDRERHWLVAVGLGDGLASPVAKCEFQDQAEVIVSALKRLTNEELADLWERTRSRTKRPDSFGRSS